MINYFQLLIESESDEVAVPLVNAQCPMMVRLSVEGFL